MTSEKIWDVLVTEDQTSNKNSLEFDFVIQKKWR